jgi:threonine dehydratase
LTSLTAAHLREVQQAIMPSLHRTPMAFSQTLSKLAGCRVYLKQELFQKTGSYKPRGMLWALLRQSPERLRHGVITFSAGNAAQGLAYAAQLLGIPATIVMPATASPAKAQATRDYGAEVILHGAPTECLAHCQMIAKERGLLFISSYDDMDLMTGHATLGAEIIEDVPDARAIFVGIGGGGMAGGLALATEALGHPARLYGIEPEGAPAMTMSLAAGHAVHLEKIDTIADGLAAPNAGIRCFDLVRRRFHSVTLVDDAAIVAATKLLMTRCKLFAEPAGAAALAGLLSMTGVFAAADEVVCVVSGGNLDLGRLKTLL